MKETGIIRRIDDLGRIVIPKEVRRTLRLHEGEPMELFINDGAVTFKRTNEFDGREAFANALVSALYASCGIRAAICDRHTVVAAFAKGKCPVGLPVTDELCELMNKCRDHLETAINPQISLTKEPGNFPVAYMIPFSGEAYCCGAIAVLDKGTAPLPPDAITNLRFAVAAISAFLKDG